MNDCYDLAIIWRIFWIFRFYNYGEAQPGIRARLWHPESGRRPSAPEAATKLVDGSQTSKATTKVRLQFGISQQPLSRSSRAAAAVNADIVQVEYISPLKMIDITTSHFF